MTGKSEAIASLESGYVGFRDLIAGLPDEAYSEVWLGEWDLDHLLAHMAGWWREMAQAFARVSRGEPPVPADVSYNDADAWNAQFAANPMHGREALDDFDVAFHEYYAAAKGLDDAFYGIDPEKNRPRIGNRLLQASGIGHFEEHRPQVEAWLATR